MLQRKNTRERTKEVKGTSERSEFSPSLLERIPFKEKVDCDRFFSLFSSSPLELKSLRVTKIRQTGFCISKKMNSKTHLFNRKGQGPPCFPIDRHESRGEEERVTNRKFQGFFQFQWQGSRTQRS